MESLTFVANFEIKRLTYFVQEKGQKDNYSLEFQCNSMEENFIYVCMYLFYCQKTKGVALAQNLWESKKIRLNKTIFLNNNFKE